MASLHVYKSIDKARANGGYAGLKASLPLWEMSKRELVEIAARLGEICADEGGAENGIARALEEAAALRANRII